MEYRSQKRDLLLHRRVMGSRVGDDSKLVFISEEVICKIRRAYGPQRCVAADGWMDFSQDTHASLISERIR